MTGFEDDISISGLTEIEEIRERALIVGVELPDQDWDVDSSLDELERLVDTAGADVIVRTKQRLSSPNPKTFVGSGKAEEIGDLCRSHALDLVVFDDELTPSQQANLERAVGKSVKVIDRTALILDIFALHAITKEGRLQVRLAQNQYLYPRLRGMWAHLASNRMGGGVGSRFGEGESQLEVDRRMVRKRITSIRRELKQIERVRAVQREKRYDSGLFKICLAGYTNAGKSCLINRLTDADVLSYDKLFATLDSTTRKLVLPEGRAVTITDTVGFIKKLPTTLVEAFKSTLDEINGADLILHVVDASSEEFMHQINAVDEVLGQINAASIPRILVLNKCDLLSSDEQAALSTRFPESVMVSAQTGEGVEDLIDRVAKAASADERLIEVLVPYSNGKLVSFAHEHCNIVQEEHQEGGTFLVLFCSAQHMHRFAEYLLNDNELGETENR